MTNGFVGEFLILLGAFQYSPWMAALSVTGVVLGATYMLWMVKRVFFGPAGEIVTQSLKDKSHALLDLSAREVVVLLPLAVLIFWMGLFPNHFMNYSKTSVDYLIKNKMNYTLIWKGGEN